MKTFLKVLGIFIAVVTVGLYLCFLFVLPNVINLNDYKNTVKELIKEQTKLDLDFENVKIATTPLLGAGAKIDNITIKLPDGSLLFSSDSIKARIALPSLFLLTAKVSCLEINNPFINLEIDNDNTDYKIVKLVENILNTQKEKTFAQEKIEEEGFRFNPEWIRIKVPNVNINNYKVLVTDLNTKHYLDLHGDKLSLGYFNGKVAKIRTYAELFSDTDKNITADININTFLPKPQPSLDSEDDPAERIDIPFVNPVEMYRNYDLRADINTKLKVRNSKHGITSFGSFNIDNVTMKVSQLKLPPSYIHAKTFGTAVTLDTDIYSAPAQNIKLLGKLNYGNHPNMDMNIKTGTIQFNDLLILGKAFLDSLQIKNELALYKAEGSVNADCYIKTNFKKLNSNGYIKVKNGGIAVKNTGKVISDSNINILLDDNILNIDKSSILVGKSKINVDGSIDNKSIADINITANNIPLPGLFKAFTPKEIKNEYNLKSGNATFDLTLKGKLKEAVGYLKFGLDNLNFGDKKNNFLITNKSLKGEFTADTKKQAITGMISNNNFRLLLPSTNSALTIPKLKISVLDKNISIEENEILFNDNSKLKYSGNVINYEKLKDLNFLAQGQINTNDLIKLMGKELKPFIHSSGSIPVKFALEGNKKKQTLVAQILADKDNFITPADFSELTGKTTSLQTVIDFKPRRIKIKKTGLFERTITVDEKGNEIINLNPFIDIDGTIEGNRINLIKIHMPKDLNGKFHIFQKSNFLLENARLFVYGNISTPIIRGGINLKNINIPELLTSTDNINLHFTGHELNFDLRNILLNKSDISVKGVLGLIPSSVTNISNLEILSNNIIDLDKLLKVADLVQKYVPQSPSGSSPQGENIPVAINSGNIDIKKVKTGNIEVYNITSRITLLRNILSLRNLKANIFKGNVNGDIRVNLLNMITEIKMSGNDIDVEKALLDAAGMKGMLSGKAEFKTDILLDGSATTQTAQMKSLKGDVNFSIKNGQFGPFGKIENLIIAENIRESQFFQTALGGIISSLTTIDTTHFSELYGKLYFQDGICYIDPITSLGNILSLHIFGDFDLIKNYADMKVRARMASLISNLLGPIGAINPANLINSAASLNVVTAKAFSIFCEMVPAEEFELLPSFSNKYVDNAATKFQLVVRGDAAKPLTLIKSFKWLASKSEIEKATEFVNSLPEEIEGSTATNIEEAIAEAKALEKEKKTLKYKVKHIFAKEDKKIKKVSSDDIVETEETPQTDSNE